MNDSTALSSRLFDAAYRGRAPAVRTLLEQGANVNARNDDGKTPLICAARAGSRTIVRMLLEGGADVNARDEDGETALFAAAWSRTRGMTELLLGAGAEVQVAEQRLGETAMMRAAGAGRAPVIRSLLAYGAHVDAIDDRGQTALMLSARRAEHGTALLQLLLDRGADPDATDKLGWSALTWAVFEDEIDCVRLLLRRPAAGDGKRDARAALFRAALTDDLDTLRELLGAGVNADARPLKAPTALMAAAMLGRARMVTALLDAGADPNLVDREGKTALMRAAYRGRGTLVRRLLAHRAEVNARDREGRTALHWATRGDCDSNTIRALLDAGAKVNARDTEPGDAALVCARQAGARRGSYPGGVWRSSLVGPLDGSDIERPLRSSRCPAEIGQPVHPVPIVVLFPEPDQRTDKPAEVVGRDRALIHKENAPMGEALFGEP
jgi:uncharacterized protein